MLNDWCINLHGKSYKKSHACVVKHIMDREQMCALGIHNAHRAEYGKQE